ncbi:putative quinol monooxygenase [Psychrobacter sp.]|uniref:putative quinol monooxygenase n=1 Tax=Psychrobacter sp. TaxID=56811 RepID=UPI003BB1AE6A
MPNNHSLPLSLIILIETKINCASQQIQAFKELQPLVLTEKGCLQYELTQDVEDENQFVLIEKWATQVDLDAHDVTPHMIKADKTSISFRARPATVFKLKSI